MAKPPEDEEYIHDDPEDVAERVRTGEYFREVKNAYATVYVNPMAERSFFLALFVMSLAILMVALLALDSIFPLEEDVSFSYPSREVSVELPRMVPLGEETAEPDAALKRFLVTEYVKRRESYRIEDLELNVRFVKAQSSQEVYAAYESYLNPQNPDSPITQYQRHSVRNVKIIGARPNADGTYDVAFEAEVDGRVDKKKTRMVATVAFHYTDVTVNQETGDPSRLDFYVTDYRLRRLQE